MRSSLRNRHYWHVYWNSINKLLLFITNSFPFHLCTFSQYEKQKKKVIVFHKNIQKASPIKVLNESIRNNKKYFNIKKKLKQKNKLIQTPIRDGINCIWHVPNHIMEFYYIGVLLSIHIRAFFYYKGSCRVSVFESYINVTHTQEKYIFKIQLALSRT